MATVVSLTVHHPATTEPTAVRWLLTGLALAYLALFLVVPLVAVFTQALSQGWETYLAAITTPDALAAIKLTLLTVAISLPLNVFFGIVAAWAIAKFEFRGKQFLITLIDLPFAVSPVVAGLIFVLVFGLATTFITFPFVARELIPHMHEQGTEAEEAALTLGASGWQTFWRVTLPSIKWSLLYGVILCNARAVGEFGAVSVVSGHIRGHTNTMPLHIEILYNEYQFAAAFAVTSLLVLLALVTLVAKSILEWVQRRDAEYNSAPLEGQPRMDGLGYRATDG